MNGECPICGYDIGACEGCAALDAAEAGPHPSWFRYGRWEGSWGGYAPPAGFFPALMYWIGNHVGRRFGPPAERA